MKKNRKQINIFSTSFLDLISGALAAVIILFVIVPKKTEQDIEIIEKVKQIEEITTSIQDALNRLENSVPKDLFVQVQNKIDNIQQKVEQLNKQIKELEKLIEQLQQQNTQYATQIASQEKTIAELKQRIKELEEIILEEKTQERTANTVEKTLGVFAEFGILCRWNDQEVDVDLAVQRFGNTPEQCWRNYPSKIWGILGEDVRERTEGDNERFELFYVPQIYPDEYTAWVNVYSGSRGFSTQVHCTMVFHPNKPDEIRVELPPIPADKTHNAFLATFRLSQSGFNLINHREPIWGNGVVVK